MSYAWGRGLTVVLTGGLTVLGQVIVESPAYRGKWSRPAPSVSDESRQQLAERIRTSERLRRALRELGYEPDELDEVVRQRGGEGTRVARE